MKWNIRKLILVTLVAVTMLLPAAPFLASSNANAAPLTWTVRTMDQRQVIMSSMAVDGNGDLHAVGFDYSGSSLLYATNSAPYGNWTDVKVDDITPYFASQSMMVLDAQGRVHIAYYDGFTKQLKYANNLDGWTKELVDVNPGTENVGSSIAVDTAGKAHISYVLSEELMYADNVGGSWTNSTLVTGEHVIYPTDIAIGGDDVVHIVYRTYAYHSLNSTVQYYINHTWNDGGGWNVETISTFYVLVTVGIVHTLGALTVDDANRPQFVYSVRDYVLPYNPRLVHVQRDAS